MVLPFASLLLVAVAAPSQPVDVRALLVELTIDSTMTARACDTVESTGSTVIDAEACLLLTGMGVEIPAEMVPETGGAPIKWKVRAAMVQFSDGSSQIARPPERMMRRAFLSAYPQGQRGAMLVEALDKKRGTRTCAFFAPRTVSRFDAAKCGRVLSVEEQVTSSAAGKSPLTIAWTNAVVAAGDL